MRYLPPSVLPLIEGLKNIEGVEAIVLGGSRARGTHTPESDVDLGLYYSAAHPLDVARLDALVSQFDDRRQPGLVTPIGGWGPRINGGGWLIISDLEVDLIYRDLDAVRRSVDECISGILTIDYQPGHPFGFLSSMYASEVALCQPLWDPLERVASLKAQLVVYPQRLKLAMIRNFSWEIQFAAANAEKAIPRMDVAYVAGSLFRSLSCMLVVLFALNEQHWMNEKGALAMTEKFAVCPPSFKARTEQAFALLKPEPALLAEAVAQVRTLGAEVELLAQQAGPFTP